MNKSKNDRKTTAGLAWLKSLPPGMRIVCDGRPAIVSTAGLLDVYAPDDILAWKHRDWSRTEWAKNASPETCPRWECVEAAK